MQKSDVVVVVFKALRIKSLDVWDFLTEAEGKKTVFVMTKCDMAGAAAKRCICGAGVPEGQFMRMECGRKIEG